MSSQKLNGMEMYNFAVLRDLRKRAAMTIVELSERTGISPAVISKLERNQTTAELKTLFRLARAFGLTAAELVSLVESRTAQCKREIERTDDEFHFRQIEFANSKCFYIKAAKGAKRSNPDVHRDDFEVCWVLKGKLRIELPYESHLLSVGDCLQFDAVFGHTYEVIEDCQMIIQHIRKDKRF